MLLCLDYVPTILSNIFNRSILQKQFPTILKQAVINPNHKKGPKNFISNYRPMSILSNVSKIFESLLYNLQTFFNSNNLLSSHQYGYRRGLGTERAILELINLVMPAQSNKEFCIIVFLDYSKCFDTLCRETLVRKFEKYGVKGEFLDFI